MSRKTIVRPEPTDDNAAYTVKHSKGCYRVFSPIGEIVERYHYDPTADFSERRAAWQLALADAEVRNEAYAAELRTPGNVTRAPLVAHPNVIEQRHEVEGVLYVAWAGRPAGEAGIYADHLTRGAR